MVSFFPFFLFSFFHFQVLGAATWERSSFVLTDSKRNMAATAVKFISIKTDEKSPTADLILNLKKNTLEKKSEKNQLKEQRQEKVHI